MLKGNEKWWYHLSLGIAGAKPVDQRWYPAQRTRCKGTTHVSEVATLFAALSSKIVGSDKMLEA